MSGYILRRILLTIPVLFGVSLIIFVIIRLLPGDPAVAIAGVHASQEYIEQVRQDMQLDEALHIQYGTFMSNLLRGDLGRSTFSRRPVALELSERFPRTVELTVIALCIASVLGITAGVIAAVKR